MRRLRAAAGALVLTASLAFMAGCGSDGETGEAPVELVVSAAASLAGGMTELQAMYEAERPQVRVVYNFGASGALQRQIEQGAQVDLFFSAGMSEMAALAAQGLLLEGRGMPLLTNELVAVTAADATGASRELTSPQGLTDDAIRTIAVGAPETVPAGQYAKAYLLEAGWWEALEPKLVYGNDVRQVLSYVETGNAEAGFVYRTDAMRSSGVRIAFAAESDRVPAIAYPAAVLKSSASQEEARRFLAFLRSERAGAVFARRGFGVIEPEAPE
ncbi:molybdate ABC transporter substrate-binding protein [Paenibacillus sp. TRM 82003]|nr:molybdate ABC transporter substrate-binding protein [Paenibacillus sp. TRM 82003]